MASKYSFVFILFALFCLSVMSLATPIKDVSSTTMAISETKTSTSDHFAVAVQRVDDLVNDNGELLAERIDAVIIDFELKNDQLLVNNVPVELGVTSVQVIEAQIVPANIDVKQLKEYNDNFDIGLVTVQVWTAAESLPTEEAHVTLRRISITIRVIEIDGVSVVQSQGAVEKILEFNVVEIADGDDDDVVPFYPAEDLSSHEDKTIGGKIKCAFHSFTDRLRRWWHCASRFTRISFASLFLTVLFGVLFTAMRALIVLLRHHTSSSSYKIIALDNDEDTEVEQVIFIADEEKQALMEQEKELKQ